MPIEISTPAPQVDPSTPVQSSKPPLTATTQEVAAHHNLLQSTITTLEGLPQSVKNAKDYIEAKMQLTSTWVQAKHVTTRLWEAIAVGFAFGTIIGFFLGKL